MKEDLWTRESWTQSEVAEYFTVTSNTIKNWRERGLLSCFKAPGSSRVSYYREEVQEFKKTYTKWRKEAGKNPKHLVRAKPRLSSDDDWRIS